MITDTIVQSGEKVVIWIGTVVFNWQQWCSTGCSGVQLAAVAQLSLSFPESTLSCRLIQPLSNIWD
jgi:hypothetical protein